MPSRSPLRATLALAAFFALWPAAAFAQAPPAASPLDQIADPARRAVFEQVWTTIRDQHFEPGDWNAVLERHAPRAAAAKDDSDFYLVVNAMLSELGQSHCVAAPPGTRKRAERATEVKPEAANAPREAGDPGIEIRAVDGVALVVAVAAGSPAAAAGVRPGSILQAVDGNPVEAPPGLDAPAHDRVEWIFATMGLLSGPAGTPVRLTLADAPGQPAREVPVGRAPVASASFGHLQGIPASFTARRLDGGYAYLRLGSFFMSVFEKFQAALRDVADAPGLVIDLRGNPGGLGIIAPGIVGFLVKERTNLGTSKMRQGELRYPVFPRPKPYLGPVAVLIDEASASTSEILAAGLQELGRARVFGRTTAGMVLPSLIHKLPDGGILQFPMADFVTPQGKRLEGVGAVPDEVVDWTAEACRAGRDPALEAALAWLKKTTPH